MSKRQITRREFLRVTAVAAAGTAVAACQPQTVVVEKEVPVTQIVKETVKETVIVEGTPKVVEKEVTKVVEKEVETVITATAEASGEPPMLAQLVSSGELPPVDERLPMEPQVSEVEERIGDYGGTWHRVWKGISDSFGVYRYNHEFPLAWNASGTVASPNVIRALEANEDASAFTLYLRKGMKWSDGEPFTAEDWMFWYEDIQGNEDLTPAKFTGMMQGEDFAKMEKLDDYTLRISFPRSYGSFGMRLGTGGFEIYSPKHYAQQFHPTYASEEELAAKVKASEYENWWELFGAQAAGRGRYTNPDLPGLHPWITLGNVTDPVYAMQRNPFYFKVDEEDNQLPYVDRMEHQLVTDSETITLMAINGEIDCQGRHMSAQNLPLYRENMEKGDYRIHRHLDINGGGAMIFNQDYDSDPVLAEFIRRKDFRIALSYAVNREEIRNIVYAEEEEYIYQQVTLREMSPGYHEEWAKAYIEYDPDRSNQMLDELGLEEKDADGFRVRPDGKGPVTLPISGPDYGNSQITELYKTYWEAVGIKTLPNLLERTIYDEKLASGELPVHQETIGPGVYPAFLFNVTVIVPVNSGSRLAPLSGLWYESKGAQGKEPPPPIKRMQELYDEAIATPDEDTRLESAVEIWRIRHENFWCVGYGLSKLHPEPFIIRNNFRNVPDLWGGAMGVAPHMIRPWTWFFEKGA